MRLIKFLMVALITMLFNSVIKLMAGNTLTGLIPTIYESLDIVSRELVGFIPAVARNSSAARAAKDQTIRIPITPAVSSPTSISPANVSPDTGEQTVSYADITISKAYQVPVKWNGEEQKSLEAGQPQNIMRDQFTQAMRILVNTIEADLASLYTYASRAYGTAGTTPFGTSLEDAAQIKKILDDNGAPDDGLRSLVMGTTAGVKLRTLSNLIANYAAGTDKTLRQGVLLPVFNMDLRESAQVKSHTKGAGTGYDIVAAGEAVGQTTLTTEGGTVNTTGIKAGDVVTFAGGALGTDLNKYVVNTGLTATSGDLIINKPGLLIAKDTSDEITVGDSYTANMAFHKDAIQLVTRAPYMPSVGDFADDVIEVTDPVSGLAFQVAMYRQYRQVHYEVGIAWGYAVIKPEHICLLLG